MASTHIIKVIRDDVMITVITWCYITSQVCEKGKKNPASGAKSHMWIRQTRVKNTDV